MSRSEAVTVIWTDILAAWDEGNLLLARELDHHLSMVESMTDGQFTSIFEMAVA